MGRECIHHTVLQGLKATNGNAKLFTGLGVFHRLAIEQLHDSHSLGRHGKIRLQGNRFDQGIGLTLNAHQIGRGYLYIGKHQVGYNLSVHHAVTQLFYPG